MKAGRTYLLAWLTLQWVAFAPLAAGLSYLLFFSDGHGLQASGYGLSIAIFAAATGGYVLALRVLLSWR
jgi:hypothetical protein